MDKGITKISEPISGYMGTYKTIKILLFGDMHTSQKVNVCSNDCIKFKNDNCADKIVIGMTKVVMVFLNY